MSSIQNEIFKTIDIGIATRLESAKFDTTHVGIVREVLGDNTYNIEYDGAIRKVKTTNDITLSVGNKVHVIYPMNSSVNKYLLEDVANGGGGGSTVTGVTSVNGQTGTVLLSTSDIPNNSDYVSDGNYIHTDNNFSDSYKAKITEENIDIDFSNFFA